MPFLILKGYDNTSPMLDPNDPMLENYRDWLRNELAAAEQEIARRKQRREPSKPLTGGSDADKCEGQVEW